MRGKSALFLGGCLLLGGCDAAPPSGPGVDTTGMTSAISTAVENLQLVMATPAMHSLDIVGARMIPMGSPAAARCGPGYFAPTHHSPLPTHPFINLISDTLYGRVYRYDAPSRSYYRTSGTGPGSGVRFLLDALDDFGQPTSPPTQVGWLDLTNATGGVRAIVRNGAATNADYLVTPTGTQAGYSASMAGHAFEGATAVVFSDSVSTAGNETSVFAVVDSAAPGVTLSLRVKLTTYDAADFRYDLDFTARRGAETIRLTGANVTFCFFASWDVAVTRNDSALAQYAQDGLGTSVTPAPGRTLSAAESSLVADLVVAQQLLFDWLKSLFQPVWRLLPP